MVAIFFFYVIFPHILKSQKGQESVLKLIDPPSDDYTFSKGYFHACTAFGKTYLMMAMAEGYNYIMPNKKIIILEENTSVLEQVKQDFSTKTEQFNHSDIGAFYSGEKKPTPPLSSQLIPL